MTDLDELERLLAKATPELLNGKASPRRHPMPNDAPLSDRVEKAEEGSRELDAEIWAAVTGGSYEQFNAVVPDLQQWSNVKPYTTSLDAAMELVPDEMRDEIEITTVYRVAWVTINLNHGDDDGPYYGNNKCNSIPLALCAAALKARGL